MLQILSVYGQACYVFLSLRPAVQSPFDEFYRHRSRDI